MVGHDVRTKFIPKTVILQMNLKIYLERNLRIKEITLIVVVIGLRLTTILFIFFFAKMVNRTDVCPFMKEKNCPENY